MDLPEHILRSTFDGDLLPFPPSPGLPELQQDCQSWSWCPDAHVPAPSLVLPTPFRVYGENIIRGRLFQMEILCDLELYLVHEWLSAWKDYHALSPNGCFCAKYICVGCPRCVTIWLGSRDDPIGISILAPVAGRVTGHRFRFHRLVWT